MIIARSLIAWSNHLMLGNRSKKEGEQRCNHGRQMGFVRGLDGRAGPG